MTGTNGGFDRDDLDAAALDRVLDGLGPGPDADAVAAHARATADVATLRRALGLIADALADPAAAAETPVLAPVVPLRRRRPSPRVLAAAASVIAGIGLGAVLLTHGGGEGGSGSQVAQGPPTAAPAPAGPQPQSERMNALAAAPTGGSGASDAAVLSAPAAAPNQPPAKVATTGQSRDDFDRTVVCARGILIGRVVSVSTSGGQTRLTVAVDSDGWITPGQGPPVMTYDVAGPYARTDRGQEKLRAGQQRLFIIPGSASDAVRDYVGPDYSAIRARIRDAQQRSAGQSCP